MSPIEGNQPWVSFCMSTYKRPELLRKQLRSLSLQSFKNFEVIISDNDPDSSAKDIVMSLNDERFKYFPNTVNLGMMKSFNKSIERASSDYIVMITDDDPVENFFLADIFKIYEKNSSYGVYAGFLRKGKNPVEIEFLGKDDFPVEILDPKKTTNILWSSCIIKKSIANDIGKIPDFGSPHLADHAFIAMAGSIQGGIIINKMYSTLTSHNSNFSKSHLDSYLTGCDGFYNTLTNYFKGGLYFDEIKKSIHNHLKYWFISNIFSLKKYYTIIKKDEQMLLDIQLYAQHILQLEFMKRYKINYYFKNFVFHFKKSMKIL